MSALSKIEAAPAPDLGTVCTEWDQAERWYRTIEAVKIGEMAEPLQQVADHALCEAMKHLIEEVKAPDVKALILKMEMVRDLVGNVVPGIWWDVLQADVSRLVGRPSVPSEGSELDRLIADYAKAEKALEATRGRGLTEGNPIEVRFLAALADLDAYEPQSPNEFVRAFAARFSEDLPPTDETTGKLIATARRLNAMIIDTVTKGDAA